MSFCTKNMTCYLGIIWLRSHNTSSSFLYKCVLCLYPNVIAQKDEQVSRLEWKHLEELVVREILESKVLFIFHFTLSRLAEIFTIKNTLLFEKLLTYLMVIISKSSGVNSVLNICSYCQLMNIDNKFENNNLSWYNQN